MMIYTTNGYMLCAIAMIHSLHLQAGMDGAEGSRLRAAALRTALSVRSPTSSHVRKKQNR